MSLSKFFNKKAKNGPIFKNQVSNYIKIKFEWGSILLKTVKFLLFQKIVNSSVK